MARLPLKNLRDKEDTLTTRRNARNNYEQTIAKLEASRGSDKKIQELEGLLKRAESEDEPLEKEILILERKAIKESEHAKWQAIREVTSPFCGYKPGRLTRHHSTERSW